MMKYFDQAINDFEKRELDFHITACSTCRLEFQWMKGALEGVEELEDFEAPDNFEIEILEQLDLKRYEPRPALSKIQFWMALAVPCIFAILSIGFYIRFGTIDWKEGYTDVVSFMRVIDLGNRMYAVLGLIGKTIGKTFFVFVKGLKYFSAFLNSRMGIYLTIVAFLCSVLVFTQYVLIKLTDIFGYRGGRSYEK
jgi:hypothetical protein